MIEIKSKFLPSANIDQPYSQQIDVSGGVSPYYFSVYAGDGLPSGLVLSSSGILSGTPTNLAVKKFRVTVTDSANATLTKELSLTVTQFAVLDNLSVDPGDFAAQLQQFLSTKNTWSVGLTSQTSQTLIELISAIAAFNTSKIIRAREDAFSETAQSDSALLAIATMQGTRLSRKLSAKVIARFENSSTTQKIIPEYSVFSLADKKWFNNTAITIPAGTVGTPSQVLADLYEGDVVTKNLTAIDGDLQTWVSEENDFTVSDRDLVISITSTTKNSKEYLTKTYGPLWDYKSSNAVKAFADKTLSDGRALILFGNSIYGYKPSSGTKITITYAVTSGAEANGFPTSGLLISPVKSEYSVNLKITAITDSSGGVDELSPILYKNFSAGVYGTFDAAVTKDQFVNIAFNYPGITDAVVQSQRDIDPTQLKFMNVIRVSALGVYDSNTPDKQKSINSYLDYIKSKSLFSGYLVWQEPISVKRDVSLRVYCFNAVSSLGDVKKSVENSIKNLFGTPPRPGILMTDFYQSDLIQAVRQSTEQNQISYVEVLAPTGPMIVSAPKVFSLKLEVIKPTGNVPAGVLKIGSYIYAVSVNTTDSAGNVIRGQPSSWTTIDVDTDGSAIRLTWGDETINATSYSVWGRGGVNFARGVIGDFLNQSVRDFLDTGQVLPVATSVPTDLPIKYNSLGNLSVDVVYTDRSQVQTKI